MTLMFFEKVFWKFENVFFENVFFDRVISKRQFWKNKSFEGAILKISILMEQFRKCLF